MKYAPGGLRTDPKRHARAKLMPGDQWAEPRESLGFFLLTRHTKCGGFTTTREIHVDMCMTCTGQCGHFIAADLIYNKIEFRWGNPRVGISMENSPCGI